MAIKAVAFDLARVFIKVRDIKLNPVEKILSETFDYKVAGEPYWDWAEEKIGLGKRQLKEISWNVINKLYVIREPDIFEKLPKLKFATASNHISMIKDWLKEKGMDDKFYCHVISEDIHFMKPSKEFYEVVIKRLDEKPEDILFVDDKEDNIEGAKKAGLKTLLYNSIQKHSTVYRGDELNADMSSSFGGKPRFSKREGCHNGQKSLSESVLEVLNE